MPTVSLDSLNFSYYAFHPKSSELSPSDQKVALAATILMGALTLGLGHLICGIVYRINKTGIDSSRLAAKTHDVATKIPSIKDVKENSIDIPIKKFKEKIDQCFAKFNLETFDSTVVLINVSFGDEAKKAILQFKKPDNDEQIVRKKVDETLNDLKNHFATESSNEFEMHFAIVGKSNTYTKVRTSILGKKGSDIIPIGPGTTTASSFSELSQDLLNVFDIDLDEDFDVLVKLN